MTGLLAASAPVRRHPHDCAGMSAPFDLLLTDVHVATLCATGTAYGAIREAAIGIREGLIVWVGPVADMPHTRAQRTLRGGGAWITPGLVDCHTHLVYAGHRTHELERRRQGATDADIAREGGGIMATVRATRAASEDELAAQSAPRLAALASEGVTTVEIKSGYGLDTANEMKQLRVARALSVELDVGVRTTLLAAHALPPEFAGRADDYIDYVCTDTIPAVAREGLADAVDAFCEGIAFSAAQTARLLAAARAHGLPVKLHAGRLAGGGAAVLVAGAPGLSGDHLECTSDEGIAAMAAAGTVAVLLPGAFHVLRETKVPPIAALRRAGVPMAIATGCNPDTSPVTSLVLMMSMACTLWNMTPEEALAGATTHAARALGLADRGTIAPGMCADLARWSIAEPAELAWRIGGNACSGVIRGGVPAFWN